MMETSGSRVTYLAAGLTWSSRAEGQEGFP